VEENAMDGIQEIDTVLQHVRQVARRFRLPSDAAVTQQILLFGDSFYGYRFTALDFTAIWSAADQILKIFDIEGQVLETLSVVDTPVESIPLIPQRRAA
jgi:hypothetical protein